MQQQQQTINHQAKPTPAAIIQEVASRYGVHPENVKGESQMKRFTEPRAIAMYLIRGLDEAKFSLPFVGGIFRRHHTSVLSAVRKVAARRARDGAFARLLDDILAAVVDSSTESVPRRKPPALATEGLRIRIDGEIRFEQMSPDQIGALLSGLGSMVQALAPSDQAEQFITQIQSGIVGGVEEVRRKWA